MCAAYIFGAYGTRRQKYVRICVREREKAENGMNKWTTECDSCWLHQPILSSFAFATICILFRCDCLRCDIRVKRRRQETANKQQPKPQGGSFWCAVCVRRFFFFCCFPLFQIFWYEFESVVLLCHILMCFHKFSSFQNTEVTSFIRLHRETSQRLPFNH